MAASRTINDGKGRSLTTTHTDAAARVLLLRVTGADRKFARDLVTAYDNNRLSNAQFYWFHKLAADQSTREVQARAAAMTPTPAPASRPVPQPTNEPETFSLGDDEADESTSEPEPVETPEPALDETKVDSLRACLLIYDIPVPRRGESEIPNPSPSLRRIAVRVNLSCWVIQEGDVPYAMLNRMAERGASWHVVPFDAKAGRQLVQMAIQSMRKEIADAVERSRQCEGTAAGVLTNEDLTVQQARQRYLARAEQIRERFNTLTSDLEAAAERFGINPNVLNIQRAHNAVLSIQTAMQNRARAYSRAARQASAVGTAEGRNLAAAMNADQVPVGVAADFIEDNGGDASSLRAAFDESTSDE